MHYGQFNKSEVGQEVTAIHVSYGLVDKIVHLTIAKVMKNSITTSDNQRWTFHGDLWGADRWNRSRLVTRAQGLEREADQAKARAEQQFRQIYGNYVEKFRERSLSHADALEAARRFVAFLERSQGQTTEG